MLNGLASELREAITAIMTGFQKSFQFSGRATRSEFWWFAPVGLGIASLVVLALAPYLTLQPEIICAICVFTLASLPVWAGASRRLRDSGRNTKLILLFCALPFAHLGFVQLFFSGFVSTTGPFGLLFGIYYFAGFALLTLLNFALFFVVLALCLRSETDIPNPNEVPQ